MNESYYDKLQKYFVQDGIQLHYQDTDSFVLSVKTDGIVGDLSKVPDQYKLFDFSSLNKEQRLFSKEFSQKPGF